MQNEKECSSTTGANICHPPARPTPHTRPEPCTPGLSPQHVCQLSHLCTLHDIKAMWMHAEQSAGLREVSAAMSVSSAEARAAGQLCATERLWFISQQRLERRFIFINCLVSSVFFTLLMIQHSFPQCSSSIPTLMGMTHPKTQFIH